MLPRNCMQIYICRFPRTQQYKETEGIYWLSLCVLCSLGRGESAYKNLQALFWEICPRNYMQISICPLRPLRMDGQFGWIGRKHRTDCANRWTDQTHPPRMFYAMPPPALSAVAGYVQITSWEAANWQDTSSQYFDRDLPYPNCLRQLIIVWDN